MALETGGLTWTSTWKPSLKVPLRMKLREVPTRNSSPFPSDTALMAPYWSGIWRHRHKEPVITTQRSPFPTYDFKVYSVLKLRCTYLYCTSMSRSALISWSHRMILRSFPPPVRRVPLLISHMQKTLPSWALTCRVIWNAAQTQICLCEPHGIITSHHMSLVLHNLVLVLGLSPLGPFPVVVSLGFLVQTSRTPPESPVRMSPELRKDRHWMNFGFSYFWKKRERDWT